MTQAKKTFLIKFAIAFAATLAVACFMIFVVLRGMFCNIYINKGNKDFDKGNFDKAIVCYDTAKSWKKSNQQVYLCLAKAYAAKEDFKTAGEIINEAIDKKITSKDADLEQLHLMRVKVFTAEGKLAEAVNYINSLSDQYMLKKLQAARPADIIYSPTQGRYDRNLKMTIEVRAGETVYYTTDGTTPTKFSNTYTAPINIGNGTTNITAIAVDSEGIVSPLLSVTYEVSNENEPVDFDDEKIEKMVRNALSKPRGVVLVKELESITELTNDGVGGHIRTLSDLDLMPNLESLVLSGEKNMLSISQLSGKSKLKYLYLSGCSLDSEDINALGSLSALEFLDISNNSITTISPLSELTAIKHIYLENNRVSDLTPLSSSEDIEFISASANSIDAIPDFDKAEKLDTLILSNNRINDLSTIHRLTSLTYLDLGSNMIKSGKNIAALTNLETLVLSDNAITNFDFIKELTKLTALDVRNSKFMNIKVLSGLPLTTLDISATEISALSGIEEFKDLAYLSVANTDITDISPLKELTALDYLDISNLVLKDLSVLFEMENLYTLKAEGFDFKGIVFANKDIQIIE